MSVKTAFKTDENKLTRCLPTDFLDEAIAVMIDAGRNAVAVIESGNHLAGILTDHDVIRAVHACQSKRKDISCEHVSDWMSKKVITCPIDTKLTGALKIMGKNHIRHLIVTDQNLPVALVSIRDILSKIHQNDELEVNVLRDIAMMSRAALVA